MSKLIIGSALPWALKQQVLTSFSYRLTTENGYPQRNPCGARVPAISDAQWLEQYAFYVSTRGTLDARRNHCEPAYMA